MLGVSMNIADVTIRQTVHTSSNQTWSSGYNSAGVLCSLCVLQQVEVPRPLQYIHVDDISILVPFFTMMLHTTTKILNFDQIRYPILDAFSVCIVQFIRVDANWSLQISSIYLLGQYINSNLGNIVYASYATTLLGHKQITRCLICAHLELVIVWYIGGIRSCSTRTSSIYQHGWYINSNLAYVICSKYITTILILEQVQFARQNRFFAFIVWYICACESFNDSNLCMPMDDMSTLTSDMSSVVHTATWYWSSSAMW